VTELDPNQELSTTYMNITCHAVERFLLLSEPSTKPKVMYKTISS